MRRPRPFWASTAVVFCLGGALAFPMISFAAVTPEVAASADDETPRFGGPDAEGARIPDVHAAAAIVYNPLTQEILYGANANDQRSIASITKVMTALVLLENEPDLGRRIQVEPSDVRRASHTYLRAREAVSVEDLFHLLMIGSDNAAARAVARDSLLGYDGFITAMNHKAAALGLESTRYTDPSGLDAGNVSSAYDMARLISFAIGNERIATAMRIQEHRIKTSVRAIRLKNTNKLLGGDLDVQGGKTGFIRKAGYCMAAMLRLPSGDPIAVVVLGAASSAARFLETQLLVNWLIEQRTPLLATVASEQP